MKVCMNQEKPQREGTLERHFKTCYSELSSEEVLGPQDIAMGPDLFPYNYGLSGSQSQLCSANSFYLF